MQLADAIQLIESPEVSGGSPQKWADLGCGSGLFTRALLAVLPQGSTVYAVDKSNTLKSGKNDLVTFLQADFETEKLPISDLNGILMANSLHYVAAQLACLERLNNYLDPLQGKYLLVEYDIVASNPWVPYPLPFTKSKELFSRAGFQYAEKLGEKKSVYHQGNIYACLFG